MDFCLKTKRVGVVGGSNTQRYRFLLQALARLYPVEFCEVSALGQSDVSALVVLNGNVALGQEAASRGIRSWVVLGGDRAANGLCDSEIRFSNSTELDVYLRDQVMMERAAGACRPMAVAPGDDVLATCKGAPVWLSRRMGMAACQLVGKSLPILDQGEHLFRHLSGGNFFGLLPLMNFLRELVEDVDWQSPAPRACFVFDDPSLHWPSYGFLDYERLAEHAAAHGYFVSIATIPLDAWWVHRKVAATFRAWSPRLSLLVHGDNHTARELLQYNGTGPLTLAAEAMRRMENLERKHRLPVLRIMEAPHGVIASEVFEHLLALGYEAALGTTERLVRYNPGAAWPATLGLDQSEMLGGGLPVLPRIRMSPEWKNDVLLAAFLRQPIVVVGHHWDVMEHLGLLAEIARLINNLRGVSWDTPLGIVRSNYKALRDGTTLNLRPYARRIQVAVPEGIERLLVHRPWVQRGGRLEMLIGRKAGHEFLRATGTRIIGPISVKAPGVLEILSPPANPVDCWAIRPPGPQWWPIVRNLLMGVRDRTAPLRYRAGRMFRAYAL